MIKIKNNAEQLETAHIICDVCRNEIGITNELSHPSIFPQEKGSPYFIAITPRALVPKVIRYGSRYRQFDYREIANVIEERTDCLRAYVTLCAKCRKSLFNKIDNFLTT